VPSEAILIGFLYNSTQSTTGDISEAPIEQYFDDGRSVNSSRNEKSEVLAQQRGCEVVVTGYESIGSEKL
jgi:hypothetical protein